MFLENKYTKIYYNIISNAKQREILPNQSERHHIIPKSIGGSDNGDNVVYLSLREHFVCHRLLTKMTTGVANTKMSLAIFFMSNRMDFSSSRTYDVIRREAIAAMKASWTDERRQAASEYMLNVYRTPELRAHRMELVNAYWTEDKRKQQREMHHHRFNDSEWYMKWKQAHSEGMDNMSDEKREARRHVGETNGMWGKTHTDEVKKKISEQNTGRLTGKSYDEIHGIAKANELKETRRLAKKKYHKQNPNIYKGKNNPNSKRVSIKGEVFDTGKEAAKYFGVSQPTISDWLRKYPDCYYI